MFVVSSNTCNLLIGFVVPIPTFPVGITNLIITIPDPPVPPLPPSPPPPPPDPEFGAP